jgi:hypothetical protein
MDREEIEDITNQTGENASELHEILHVRFSLHSY